jgi:hypothetical protein
MLQYKTYLQEILEVCNRFKLITKPTKQILCSWFKVQEDVGNFVSILNVKSM